MEQYESPLRYHNVVQRIQAASTVSEALVAVQTTYGVDFATYHLALTVANFVDTPYVRTTYPHNWVSHYFLSGHATIDPVLREGLARETPFDWREVDIPTEAYEFLREAQQHGLGANGYSIPIVDKKRRALFSLNSKRPSDQWSEIVDRYRNEWRGIGFHIHGKAIQELHGERDPVPQLGNREKECLYWTALGKNSKDIAVILELSEHTVQSYLTSARNKLGATTIASATSRAIQLRLINPYGDSNTLN
ncbi:helix-turn-helix transcriptional regulator [Brucella intermedia]|uniref:helix-turn-helix transcriptional regulator n=1 Tax=Brucella intermedia TaxID=94625 RepID=UPI00235F4F98|nr:LuxR family transcriptional regulator [Brucella intermedia]